MVNHIEHGEILFEKISNLTNKRVYFIRGIAISAIFSTGVNIKNLHNIIFAAGGKSFIRTVQSIGRGLRKHSNKEKLVIIDLVDNLRYSLAHSIKRQEIYTKEKIKFTTKYIKQT